MADNKKGGLDGALDKMGQSPDLAKSFEPVVKIINDVVVATTTIKDIEAQLTKEKSEQLQALANSIEEQKQLARDESKSAQEKAEANKKAKALMIELENQREDIKKKSEKAAEARQSQMMKQINAEEKESIRQRQALEVKNQLANLKQQHKELIAMGDDIGAKKLQDEINNLEKVADLTGKKYAKITEKNAAEKLAYEQHLISLEQAGQQEINDMLEQAGMDENGRLKAHYTEAEKKEKELNDLRSKWQKEKTAAEEAAQEALQKNDKEYQKKKLAELKEEGYDDDSANARIAKEAAEAEEKAKKAKEQFSKTSGELSDREEQDKADKDAEKAWEEQKKAIAQVASSLDSRMDNFTKYQATVNARLQGSTERYQLALLNIQARLSFSPFVKQQDVIENIKKLSDEGIAYNLEQRAFLQTISDKIANTFNAADGTLLRLIRLQQADTTAARLGMEAMLTKYLNRMFEDTSYLSGAHDPVNNNMMDAFSQMSRDVAAEFEFTVHKWLGALSSLGISDNALTNIAQGINYLATGDVTSLSSNESLQTLMAMTTSKMSKSYSDILVEGLDVDTTNELLREMVEYLKELAESDNMVVKNQFAKIFGMSMSDLTAISNLTNSEIKQISGYNTSYDSMVNETDLQLKLMPLRMSMSEMISNVTENFYDQLAYSISANPVTRILKDNEYYEELKKKLLEETKEFLESDDIEEIADIEEVILAILKHKDISFEQLEKIRIKKVSKRGSFDKKIFLENEI
jgi:predicted house-cleaning noncanonical NTP pyrophosphatase (MazG superfamily)